MKLIPLKTPLIKVNNDLFEILLKVLQKKRERLQNGDILVIASKAVAYAQGRVIPAENQKRFQALVEKEAEKIFGEGSMRLTLVSKMLCPNAGIDRSNVPAGMAVLWPAHPFKWARQFRQQLADQFHLKKIGVMISDCACFPMRKGVVAQAIGWAGFEGVTDERGKKDLYGQKMTHTTRAIADSMATAANLLMGETNASTPLVIVREAPVNWTAKKQSAEDYWMDSAEDIYKDILNIPKSQGDSIK